MRFFRQSRSAKKCETQMAVFVDEPRMTDEFATKYGRLHHRINRDTYKDTGEASSLDLKYECDIQADSTWFLM
jgi:hypothetical protein